MEGLIEVVTVLVNVFVGTGSVAGSLYITAWAVRFLRHWNEFTARPLPRLRKARAGPIEIEVAQVQQEITETVLDRIRRLEAIVEEHRIGSGEGPQGYA